MSAIKKRLKRVRRFVFFGLILGVSQSAFAEEQIVLVPVRSESRPKHILNGHVFLPSPTIPNPFANSTGLLEMGMGFGTINTSSNQALNLGSFTPQLAAQVAIFSRFALGLGVSGNTIVGLNSETVIQYGASTSYDLSFSALYEIIRAEKAVLTVGLRLDRPHTLAVSPIEASAEAVNEFVSNIDANYVTNTETTIWRPNLRFAYALSSVFGLRSLLGFHFNSSTEDTGSSSYYSTLDLGLGFDATLKPTIGIPIGITANYFRGQTISSIRSNVEIFSVGLYETFKETFNMGVELGTLRSGGTPATLVAVTVRTYFD